MDFLTKTWLHTQSHVGHQFDDWPHEEEAVQPSVLAQQNSVAGTRGHQQKVPGWPVKIVKCCTRQAWRTKTWLSVENNVGQKWENWPHACMHQPWHEKEGLQLKKICKTWGVTCDQELQGPTDVATTPRSDDLSQLAAREDPCQQVKGNTRGKRSNPIKSQSKTQLNAQPSVGRKCEFPVAHM